MKKMSTSELTARINRFMDRKMSRLGDESDLTDRKARRSHHQHSIVSTTPYIALAIK